MPMIWKDNEVAVCHRGVTLYHLNRNDDGNDRVMEYHYGTEPDTAVNGGLSAFDIRDFDPAAGEPGADHPAILRREIDEMFENGKGSFLVDYMPNAEIPEPDERMPSGTMYRSTIVVWSRNRETGADVAITAASGYPEAVTFRTACEEVAYPEADPEWGEACDEAFRGK